VSSLAGDRPLDAIKLLRENLIPAGYKSEKNYFILRAIFEFLMHGFIPSAKTVAKEMWDEDDFDSQVF